MEFPTILHLQATRRSRKVARPVSGPESGQGAVPLCSGTLVLSDGREEIDDVGVASWWW